MNLPFSHQTRAGLGSPLGALCSPGNPFAWRYTEFSQGTIDSCTSTIDGFSLCSYSRTRYVGVTEQTLNHNSLPFHTSFPPNIVQTTFAFLILMSLAHEHLDRAIVLYRAAPPAARAYFLRAKVWSAQGDNDNAIFDLEKATQLSADYYSAWFDLSQLKHSNADFDGAFSAAKKVVDLSPKDARAHSWLGQLYLEDGDAAQAVKHVQIARSLGADDKVTLYSIGFALSPSW